MCRSEPQIAEDSVLVVWEPWTKVAWRTSSCDFDDGIVGMLNLGLRHLADADLERLLVVDCFHHGGCGGRHDCGGVLMKEEDFSRKEM